MLIITRLARFYWNSCPIYAELILFVFSSWIINDFRNENNKNKVLKKNRLTDPGFLGGRNILLYFIISFVWHTTTQIIFHPQHEYVYVSVPSNALSFVFCFQSILFSGCVSRIVITIICIMWTLDLFLNHQILSETVSDLCQVKMRSLRFHNNKVWS